MSARDWVLMLIGSLISICIGAVYLPGALYIKADAMRGAERVCRQIGRDVAHVTVAGKVTCKGGWKK